jgi:S1-C subfamily serine protease
MKFRVGLLATSLWAASALPSPGATTGTGFVINPDGLLLTNNHVITKSVRSEDKNILERECERLEVKGDKIRGLARIIGRDQVNDLAVIRIHSDGATPFASGTADRRWSVAIGKRPRESGLRSLGEELSDRSLKPPVSPGEVYTETEKLKSGGVRFAVRSVRPGQRVSLYGFPFGESVSSQLKVTSGIVVSTLGPGNDSSLIQIDTAVNPGNSGGPLLDSSGDVVAILSSGFQEAPGFNFAVNAVVAKQFLESMGVAYAMGLSSSPLSSEELFKRIRPFVVLITCF